VPFYQFDSSGLVKRYVREVGSQWVRTILRSDSGNIVSIAEITRAEVASALSRRAREGQITQEQCSRLIQTLEVHCATRYPLVPTDHAIVGLAVNLLQRHPLRAYDAIQLSTALTVSRSLAAHGIPSLIFVSADDALNVAAQAEGLATENPNQHP
jgi:predicted nucleic acid-binding protein